MDVKEYDEIVRFLENKDSEQRNWPRDVLESKMAKMLKGLIDRNTILQKFVDDLSAASSPPPTQPSSPPPRCSSFFPSQGYPGPRFCSPGTDALPIAIKYPLLTSWTARAAAAGAFIDGCSSADVKLSIESPTSKLLYNKEVHQYKEKVKSYQSQLLRRNGGFNVESASNELLKYAIKYHEVVRSKTRPLPPKPYITRKESLPQKADVALHEFVPLYFTSFPVQFVVTRCCDNAASVSLGNDFIARSTDTISAIFFKDSAGNAFSLLQNSDAQIGLIYDPHNSLSEAYLGFELDTSSVIEADVKPKLLRVTRPRKTSRWRKTSFSWLSAKNLRRIPLTRVGTITAAPTRRESLKSPTCNVTNLKTNVPAVSYNEYVTGSDRNKALSVSSLEEHVLYASNSLDRTKGNYLPNHASSSSFQNVKDVSTVPDLTSEPTETIYGNLEMLNVTPIISSSSTHQASQLHWRDD
eukprot:Em0014g165a